MTLPKGTTHIWTPAVDTPFINAMLFRRTYYKRNKGVWYSYTLFNTWVKTNNPDKWFELEKSDGYFVTKAKFLSPSFKSKEEHYGNT